MFVVFSNNEQTTDNIQHYMSSKEKAYWIKSGSYSFLDRIVAMLLGLANLMLLYRAIDKSQFGLWFQFLIVTAFIEMGRSGLIQNALIRYVTTSKKEEIGKINTASLFINITLSFLSILILFLIAKPFANAYNYPDLISMFYFYMLTTLMLIPFYQFLFIQQANMDFKGIFWSNLMFKGLLFLFILFHFASDLTINIYVMSKWLFVCAFGGTVAGFIFAKKYLVFSKALDWNWVIKLFNFGKYTWGTSLSTIAYKFTDRTMLGTMISEIAIAVYEPAIRLTNLVDVPALSIAAVVFPQSSHKSKDGDKNATKDLYEKSVGAILALIIPALVIIYIFAEFFVWILGGEEAMESAPILRLTIFFALFMPFAYQFGTILDSIGKPKINFIYVLSGLVLNIIFNYFFIKAFQIKGAIYGTLLTYFVMFIFQMITLNRMFKIKPWMPFVYIPWFYKSMFGIVKDFLANRNKTASITQSTSEIDDKN